MTSKITTLLLFTGLALSQKIVLTNDDGWAVANIRAQYSSLTNAGFDVVLSAPAENGSGSASLNVPPTPVLTGCEYDSCPPLSPPTGNDPNNPRLNYVNSFPATSSEYGVQQFGPKFFNGQGPDFVVSGPNVGSNVAWQVLVSGTVGAACKAADLGVPAVAFSGAGGDQVSYTTLSTPSADTTTAQTYASLTTSFVQHLLRPGAPKLPTDIILNVNYPAATGECTNPSAYKFVLTRLFDATFISGSDVKTCGSSRLPTESSVIALSGCYASVSVMDTSTKTDADASSQATVLNILGNILTCAP